MKKVMKFIGLFLGVLLVSTLAMIGFGLISDFISGTPATYISIIAVSVLLAWIGMSEDHSYWYYTYLYSDGEVIQSVIESDTNYFPIDKVDSTVTVTIKITKKSYDAWKIRNTSPDVSI